MDSLPYFHSYLHCPFRICESCKFTSTPGHSFPSSFIPGPVWWLCYAAANGLQGPRSTNTYPPLLTLPNLDGVMAETTGLPILSKNSDAAKTNTPSKKGLSALPNEVLDTICSQLESNNDLRNLALTCHQLQRSAQEALFTPFRPPPRRRWRQLFETLLDRPDLASRAKTIDIDLSGLHLRKTSDDPFWSAGSHYHTEYKKLITDTDGLIVAQKDDLISNITDQVASIPTCLILLSIILPKVRELRLRLPVETSSDFLLNPQFPFRFKLLDCYGKFSLVKKLVLHDGPNQRLVADKEVSLQGFWVLQHLKAPLELLRTPLHEHVSSSIEVLELEDGLSSRMSLVEQFTMRREAFSKLEVVTLVHDASLSHFIVKFLYGCNQKSRLEAMVRSMMLYVKLQVVAHPEAPMVQPRTTVTYTASDLLEEVKAFNLLSSLEIGVAVQRGLLFSKVVARDNKGAPRKRSRSESKMVSIYPGVPISLFTSPNFNPQVWSKVRMFMGSLQRHQLGPPESQAKKTQKSGGRNKGPRLDAPKSIDFECFTRKPELLATKTCGTFDPSKWSEVDFFPASNHKWSNKSNEHSKQEQDGVLHHRKSGIWSVQERLEMRDMRSSPNPSPSRSSKALRETWRKRGHGKLTSEEMDEFNELLDRLQRQK